MQDKYKQENNNGNYRPQKGEEPCLGGEPGFYLVPYLCGYLSFEGLFLEPLSLLENVVCTFLYNA
jgi:hypothetical protein